MKLPSPEFADAVGKARERTGMGRYGMRLKKWMEVPVLLAPLLMFFVGLMAAGWLDRLTIARNEAAITDVRQLAGTLRKDAEYFRQMVVMFEHTHQFRDAELLQTLTHLQTDFSEVSSVLLTPEARRWLEIERRLRRLEAP